MKHVYVVVDTNDADYIGKIVEVAEETLEHFKPLIEKIKNFVLKAGGSVEKTEKWGVKKLAYPIDYKTEGYYVYMAFEGDCNLVQEMKRVVGISEGVIRRLITKR